MKKKLHIYFKNICIWGSRRISLKPLLLVLWSLQWSLPPLLLLGMPKGSRAYRWLKGSGGGFLLTTVQVYLTYQHGHVTGRSHATIPSGPLPLATSVSPENKKN